MLFFVSHWKNILIQLSWDLLGFWVWGVLLLHFLLLLAQLGGSSLWGTRRSLCIPACTTGRSLIPYLVAVLEKAVFASEFLFQVLNEGLFCSSNFLVWCLLHRVDAGLLVIHGLRVTTRAGRENKVIPIGLLDYLLQLHRMHMKMWTCLLKTVVQMNPQSIWEMNRPSWVIEYQNLKGKKHHGAAKSLSVLPQHSFSIPTSCSGPSQPDPVIHSHPWSWVVCLILKDARKRGASIRTGCKGLLEVTALCADSI